MKKILISILMSVAILSTIVSCATTPKGPLEEGEVRLLSMEVPQSFKLGSKEAYQATINFKSADKPEIRRVCMTWSGDGPYCVLQNALKYVSDTSFRVPISPRLGSHLECYVEYSWNGKIRRTNTLSSHVEVY